MRSPSTRVIGSFLCGGGAVLLSALLFSLALAFSGEDFLASAAVVFMAHIPIMVIEGALTVVIVGFLTKAMPELLSFSQETRHAS